MKKVSILLVGKGYIGSSFLSKYSSKYNFFVSSTKHLTKTKKIKNISLVKNLLLKGSNFDELQNVSTILFTASPTSFKKSNKKSLDAFISKFEIFLTKFKNSKIKNLIYLSSSSLYGVKGNKVKFRENDKTYKDTIYRKEKYFAEKCIFENLKNSNKNFSILRLSNPYGIVNKFIRPIGFINICFDNMQKGKVTKIHNNGQSIRDFIYIEDLLSAIDCTINSNLKKSIINIGSGKGNKVMDVIQILNSSNYAFSFKIKNEITNYIDNSVLNLSKAKKDLNYVPKYSLNDGLNDFMSKINNK